MDSENLIHDGKNSAENLFPQDKGRGLVPRDYAKQPVGSIPGIPPMRAVNMPLIPRSEWSQRAKDLDGASASLKHVRDRCANGSRMPSLDQGSVGYSHTADTEVLTEKGWTPWPEYNGTDLLATVNLNSHLMEFQAPTERHAYEYKDEMYYCTHKRLDFGVTRNHRMIVRKWDERLRRLSNHYTEQRADSLGFNVGMMSAPRGFIGTEFVELAVEGDRNYDGDDFLALLSLVGSDGYVTDASGCAGVVSFCCFNEGRYPAVAVLAARTGFRERDSRRGVFIRTDAHALAAWIKANGYISRDLKSPYKKIPNLVKQASARQIQHYLDFFGDKNHSEGSTPRYYSSSKRMIDDLQELLLRIGRRGTISERGPREAVRRDGVIIRSKDSYSLGVSERGLLSIERKKQIETDRYKGLVYCATVPNGTLVTRRNGSVLISGNCWAHSSTHAIMLARAVANEPYVPLSAYCIAATIKEGADEGGWGALSAEFAMSRGIMPQSIWPQGDRNYRSYDKPENWAEAKKYLVTEGWVDVEAEAYDRKLTFDQQITLLLSAVPVVGDHNWWGHSICHIRAVEGNQQRKSFRDSNGKRPNAKEFDTFWGTNDPVTGGWGSEILNSWSDKWGDNGTQVLTGSKAVIDGGVGIRVVVPSA